MFSRMFYAFMLEEINIKTGRREELTDITEHVRRFAEKQPAKNGLVTVFVPHTTAAVTINENADPDVAADMLEQLSEMVPEEKAYAHAEGNSDAHIKASIVGNSAAVIVENGRLLLGSWQGIYFAEFDGPRSRKVWLKFTAG